MHWEDERYVRLYTRDSTTWLKWTWEGRTVFALLLRKLDRAGVLPLDGEEPADCIALQTGLPVDVAERGWAQISKPPRDGKPTAMVAGDCIVFPNYVVAQTTASSTKKRARDYRDRITITKSDDSSQNVTDGAESVTRNEQTSRAVTPRHSMPSCTVPSGAVLLPPNPPLAGEGAGGDSTDSPPAAVKATRGEKKAAVRERHQRDAVIVLDELNTARQRVIPGAQRLRPTKDNLQRIAERLEGGATLDECRKVIAVCEREVQDGGTSDYFDAVSPFRAENFTRKLSRYVEPEAEPAPVLCPVDPPGTKKRGVMAIIDRHIDELGLVDGDKGAA